MDSPPKSQTELIVSPLTVNNKNDGYVHRNSHRLDYLTTVPDESEERGFATRTVYDIFVRARKLFGPLPCLGTRAYLRNGQRGPYQWRTYGEVAERADGIMSALRNLGVQPGDKVGTYSINREEVVIGDLACYSMSSPTVSLYDTLGEDSIEYVLFHAEAVAVFCSRDKTKKILSVVNKCPKLRIVIQMEDWAAHTVDAKYRDKERGDAELQSLLKSAPGVKLVEFEDLVVEGLKNPREPVAPKPDELVSILYTSGTTGVPKGVMLTHANVLAAVSAFHNTLPTQPDDVHLSYLPLAHIYERVVFAGGMYNGTKAGFYQGDVKKLVEDIVELQPTVFCGVPRVFSKIYDRIMQTVNTSMWHRRELFHWAYATKVAALKAGETTPYLDKFVFSKIAARLGGRVRLIVTGSAPLSPQLHEFLTVVLCVPVMQGYGLSETAAAASVSEPESKTSGHCGQPVQCTEVKLVSIPEMNYLVTDNPPKGEILLRGPNIFKGYYKMPEQTNEVFTADGWFMTGDVGRWNEDGTLSIIDRKKNIFKLAQGEYVASEKLEIVFQRSSFIQQIFVYGDSFEDHLVAIIVPEPEFLRTWAEANLSKAELAGGTAALCQNPKVRKLIADELEAKAKEEKLKGFEYVHSFHLEPNEWTPDNGLVTPTFKLKRPTLKQHYGDVIKRLYKPEAQEKTKARL